jgi:hypothetical protein
MLRTLRIGLTLAGLTLVMAGCSSSGASIAPEPPAQASQPASSVDAAPPEASAPPDATAVAATQAAGGGGQAGGACALISAADAAAILGSGDLTEESIDGDPSYCTYRDGAGDIQVATSMITTGGASTFDIWRAASGVETLESLGDGALWDPSSESLFLFKNGTLVGITAGAGSAGGEKRLEWAKALAALAVGRM